MENVICYVCNIPYTATESDLRSFFAPYELRDVYIIPDREKGRSRGFAFVEPSDPDDAEKIIATFSGRKLGGQTVNVSLAYKDSHGGIRRAAPSYMDRRPRTAGLRNSYGKPGAEGQKLPGIDSDGKNNS
jgi:RNA recognition motif-containing protein